MNDKRTILHVDDDPEITRIVGARLTAAGYEVTSLNDPRQVLAELDRSRQRLVLLDVDMPYVNGLDLLQEIRAEYGGTQVIMLTALVSMQTLRQSFRCGAEFCMFKPVTDMGPLLEVVDRTFWKIDQWRSALDDLSAEQRNGRSAATQPSEEAELPAAASASGHGPWELQS